jgi:ATP-dependent Clp protease ATP-binding subunit ClpB
VILFDEIEKAHPDVFNILLQVLDEGRLTDGKGRTVDFKNTVLIMTSNVASDLIQESATKDIPDIKGRLMDALRRTFRPEFLNRIDEIVTFGSLGEEQIRRIVEIQFQDLRKRVAEKKIEINLSPEAATLLAHVGYDPVFGARPLKRAVQRMVENPLALQILAGHFHEGDRLTVEPTKDGDLAFRREERKPQAA